MTTTPPNLGFRKSSHSLTNKCMRAVWCVVQGTLFRWSPRPFYCWRAFLLRLFGADVTMKSRVYPKVKIWAPWNLSMENYATLADDVDCYCVGQIRIGARSTVSQYSYLCGATHDYEDLDLPLIPKDITIGSEVWIAADSFIAPGVTIGDGVVVGARSEVFRDLPEWTVCFGSPATPKRPREIKTKAQEVST